MKQTTHIFLALGLAAIGVAVLAGCGNGDTNDRHPTKAEGQSADVKRQAYIDSLNIPADQKARMKAMLGGAPAPSPMAAAQANAPKPGAAKPGVEADRNK